MSFTTPTFLAVKTTSSGSFDVARKRAITLYRAWQKGAPEVVALYLLEIPVSAIRSKVRQEFERHRYVTDLNTIDVLLFKGQAELQETLNYWKQKNHIMDHFRDYEVKEQARIKTSPFIDKFLEGR